jgi:hypothetical protein
MDWERISNLGDKDCITRGHNTLQFSSLMGHENNNINITAQEIIK